MKALFEAVCDFCEQVRPHCAYIRLRYEGKRMKLSGLSVACEECREKLRGQFLVDARHIQRSEVRGHIQRSEVRGQRSENKPSDL